jgi:dephospho-CoA kinase
MIIGIAGKAGSGKGTVAKVLVEQYGFKELAFASPLKIMLASIGWAEPSRDKKEELIEGFEFTWRQAAQALGTEWGRALDPDIWVKITLQDSLRYINVVFSDVRFQNEALAVRERGILLHVEGRATTAKGSSASHPSEAGVLKSPVDHVLDNSKDPEHLERQIHKLLSIR